MEPTGFKSKGSFGIPAEMQRDLEDQRRNANAKGHPAPPTSQHPKMDQTPPAATDPIVDALKEATQLPAEKSAAEKEAEFMRLKNNLEATLETKITQDDIKDYIFKGVLNKEVCIIPGVLNGTFRTLTPTEFLEVDEREAQFRDGGKYTLDGVLNSRAIVTLSYCWIAAGGKPLSAQNDAVVREKHIRKLGAHLVDAAVNANTNFNTLLRLVLQEKSFVKKS